MYKNILGGTILLSLIMLLMLFPFAATLFDDELSYIEVKNPPQTPWFLEKEQQEVSLLYFGYVGCSTVCGPRLQELSKLYKELKLSDVDVKLYFINLTPEQKPEYIQRFAEFYNKDFHGVYANKEQVQMLNREFNLALNQGENEIGHSSNLFVLRREKEQHLLKYIYTTRPYNVGKIMQMLSSH